MATYNVLYVSTAIPSDLERKHSLPNSYTIGQVNCGTSSAISSTTQDLVELSIVTGATYQITKKDIELALLVFQKWLHAGALSSAADETGYGLDGLIAYLIEDGNTVAGVP